MGISDVLGRKNATRDMSDEEFEEQLPVLAEELAEVSYLPDYSMTELVDDWKKLCKYTNKEQFTSAITRPGVKLCEHFFPNFWDIENDKGQKFSDFWIPEKLIKVLRWNRSSHSTPYLSELKRGVYFCNGLTKSTMYRPHMAKMICDYYQPKVVLDPCAGWGGRMLGAVASGARYIAFEPNVTTFENLERLASHLDIADRVQLINDGAETMVSYMTEKVDLILTSPPYFNLEVYAPGLGQSENMFSNYQNWRDLWLKVVIEHSLDYLNPGGVSCWNTQNVGKMKIFDDVIDIHKNLGYNSIEYFGLSSSARQANQNLDKNKKTSNLTACFSK